MKSKSPRRNTNDFYSSDDSVGRPANAPGKNKRDRKPSIYDEDDDYDYRKDLQDEDENDFFKGEQIDDDDFNEDDLNDEDFDDEDFESHGYLGLVRQTRFGHGAEVLGWTRRACPWAP